MFSEAPASGYNRQECFPRQLLHPWTLLLLFLLLLQRQGGLSRRTRNPPPLPPLPRPVLLPLLLRDAPLVGTPLQGCPWPTAMLPPQQQHHQLPQQRQHQQPSLLPLLLPLPCVGKPGSAWRVSTWAAWSAARASGSALRAHTTRATPLAPGARPRRSRSRGLPTARRLPTRLSCSLARRLLQALSTGFSQWPSHRGNSTASAITRPIFAL